MSEKEKENEQLGPLEDGILRAMRAIDNQIARAEQRSPAEREVHGVQKWEPIEDRVELVSAFVLTRLGQDEVQLDSMIVLARAFSKALSLLVEELGEGGLGTLRTNYCLDAAREMESDILRIKRLLQSGGELN